MSVSNVHLITFGGGTFEYRRSARRLELQADTSGLFTTITKVTDKSFPTYCPTEWVQHQNFMRHASKGFGYWIWKPIIIMRRLAEIPPGDILLYLDAGCELNLLNAASIERFEQYFQLARENGSLAMQLRDEKATGILPSENRYSKASLISVLKPTKETLAENQLLATVILMQNTESNLGFLQRWLELAVIDNYSLIIDDFYEESETGLVSHRHDQSIFSILYKDLGKYHIPDETYWKPDWITRGSAYPIWAMRNRTGISQGVMKVPDNLDKLVSKLLFAKKHILRRLTVLFCPK